ncbi:glycosyl hydrolase family 57 [Aphanothece minutissima]|uniref:Glycosyl hydrolase family 57 n=1 Tax=Aphanothece cf. minutissima CCALA 015 TaxID=2107695 RepID=A0ABX5F646_9CHRO|nr:glycosyl hydrolase family 57 [Aphanothece minutissima]PSB36988.1 glycosyl hydrolase family 57 [Aphanothece cf. minutissima CCALA 015]
MPHPSLPPIAGREAEILALVQQSGPVALPRTNLRLEAITSAFACALHMHQPTIPAGADGALISHLQYMLEHPGEGDNHNAEPFAHCYRRLADLIPQLIGEGANPRIMLDYSGNLLWGFQQMGRADILEALTVLACDPSVVPHVEWLGTFWSHAVAPSTPIPDLKLQILAWQHHFAALFGSEALQRVKGFSPPEMHLPNHPDTLFAFVSALRDCGYRWLLVQEHSVENPDGSSLTREQTLLPNRLVARSSSGEEVSITALIKTQGSDTKLVGQMQPCYEALGLGRLPLGGTAVPALVAQIADGENGGVMMNEFPPAFLQAHRRLAAQDGGGSGGTVAINGSEYLELLEAAGVGDAAFPVIQAVGQHRLWQHIGATPTPQTVETAITGLQAGDPSFSMAGASWTNDLSWVEGYANVLEPMNLLSARFHQVFDPLVAEDPAVTRTQPYQEALLHLLLLETSCFRYWGQGTWTDYAREIHRRGEAAIARVASALGALA